MHLEDAPTKAPMRPHHLGYGARYAERPWFSRSKFASDRGARKRASRARTMARKG